jgi:hypothetical protein
MEPARPRKGRAADLRTGTRLFKNDTRKDAKMTTEIATNSTPARGLALATNDEISFDALIGMGEKLRRTGFLPSHIKDGIAFAAIVLMGRERGIGTMSACQRFSFIKGVPTEKADSQLARFKSCGGRSQFKELTEAKAVLWLRHPNGDEHTETFTIEDAKRAGLSSNDNYSKHPKAMLRSRAITAGLKSVGWEGAVGIYDPDEIADAPAGESLVKSVTQVAPGMTVAHVKQFEKPGDELATADDMVKARHYVQGATQAQLERMQGIVEQRLKAGFYTPAQADELLNLVNGRIDILTSTPEEVGA